MTLIDRMKEKRELRKVWSSKPTKSKPLTEEQKAQNKLAAEGIAIAIQRQFEKELAAEAEETLRRPDTFQSMLVVSPESFGNVSEVTIYMPDGGNSRGTENVFKLAPKQSSTSND